MASSPGRFVVHVPTQGVLRARYTGAELGSSLNAGLLFQRYAGLPLFDSRPGLREAGDKNTDTDRQQLVDAMVFAFEMQREEGAARLRDAHGRLDRHRREGFRQELVDLRLETPLAIGLGYDHPLENGMLFHQTLGTPYLPATSVKGMLRAWVGLLAPEVVEQIFGQRPGGDDDAGSPGRLIVLDALPLDWPELTGDLINCHLPDYYSHKEDIEWPNPGAVPREAPRPALFLAVKAGVTFRFRLAASEDEGVDLAAAGRVLADALALQGIGAKRAAGYGRVGEFNADNYTDPKTILKTEKGETMLPTLFLSHQSDDKDTVRALATALTRRGLLPWLDEDQLTLGADLHDTLTAAIRDSLATVALITPGALASGWVDQELGLAMDLEAAAGSVRILPLLVGVGEADLKRDPRFNAWFKGGRLNRLFVDGSGEAAVVADAIARAVGAMMELNRARQLKLVCDSRGSGRLVGPPDAVAPMELPTVVLRPHRGERRFDLALVDEDWDAWRDDMSRGLAQLLGAHTPRGGVWLQLACQQAAAVWLGARFDRQVGVPLRVHDRHLAVESPWRLASGHTRGLRPSGPLQVLSDVRGSTTTVLVWDGSPHHKAYAGAKAWHNLHGDGPLLALDYSQHLDEANNLPPDFDLSAWANQAVADLTQGGPAHLRLVLVGPVWMAVALGHLLTRIEVQRLSVLEWDAQTDRFGSCRIR